MAYFLTVHNKDGSLLHHNEKHPTLESVLQIISENYLLDAEAPHRWNGYFAVKSGELTRLYINSCTSGQLLRDDIRHIDIMNDRGLLETETWNTEPAG